MKPRRVFFASRLSLPLATALVALFHASQAQAQTRTWAGATVDVANGAWGTTTNWSGGDIPDTDLEIASFSADWSGSGPTFALGGNRTVNGIIYSDTGTAKQAGSIVAGSTLTLSGTSPTITTTNSLAINSILSWGATGLNKTGAVTLTLSGNNTGTGLITLSAGILRATTSANALGTGTAALSMAAGTAPGTVLQLANDTGLSFARNTTITGSGTATITSDRLNAGAGVTHTLGTLSIGAQTLSITRGSGATSGTGGITFGATTQTGNATYSTAADTLLTLGAVSGSFNLTKTGAGTLALPSTNSHTGVLSIAGGIINASSFSNYGVASALGNRALASETSGADSATSGIGLRFANGTLQYTGSTAQSTNRMIRLINGATAGTIDASGTGSGTLSFTGTTNINLFDTAGTRTLTLTGSNTGANTFNLILADQGSTYTSGVAAGATSLTKSGAGNWNVTGGNIHTGVTTISGGTLTVSSIANAGVQTTITTTAGSNSATVASATGLAIGMTVSASTIPSGNSTIATPVTITNISGTTLTLSSGTGITAGTAQNAVIGVANPLGLAPVAATNLVFNNGTLAYTGASTTTNRGFTLTGAGTLDVAGSSVLIFNGAIGGTSTLTKTNTGTLSLGGVIGSGAGGLAVTGGTLIVGNANNTFTGNITVSGASSALQMTSGSNGDATSGPLGINTTAYKTVTLTSGGIFRPSATYNVNTPSASLPGNGQVFSIGTGGGVFDVGTGVTFTLDDGSGAAGTAWTAPQLQGGGALTKAGLGTLSLGAGTSNFGTAFTGTITVSAGLLQLGNAGSPLGNTTSGTTVASGAALNVNGTTQTAAEPLTITGTGLAAGPQGALTSGSANAATWVGPVTLGGNATIGSSAAGGLTLGGTATVNTAGNILTLRNSSTGRLFTDGIISGAGSVVMNSPGTGDYVPRADHTYSGGTTHTAGFIAVDRNSTGLPGSLTAGPFGTGTLDLAGGQIRSGTGSARTIGNAVTISANTTFFTTALEKTLTFTGPVTLSGGSHILTSNVGATVANTATVINGAIGDAGNALGLTIAGTGNLFLGGANTYTGPTTVNSGRVFLSGSLNPASALSVSPTLASGATLTLGNGSANPVSSSGPLALGSATGPVNLALDLGANTAGSDSINTTAAATTTGTVNLAILPLAGFGSASSYDLLTASGGLAGATYAVTSAPGGYTYSVTASGTLVSLNVTPSTAGDLYWRGDTSSSWSTFSGLNTNWFADGSGSTNAQVNPGGGDTVIFSTVNATNTAGVITTTLDNNFTVNDLVFGNNPNGVNSVTIAGGTSPAGIPGVLSIAPASSSDGIVVGTNAGNIALSAPVLLGTSQTWTVDGTGPNGSSLNVSGAVSGSAGLGISGLVTLSAPGNSTYTGTITVPSGGILQGGATNSFGTSSSVTVTGTGIVRLNGINQTVVALSGNGTVQNNHASTGATLTVGDASNSSFSGVLQNGAGGVLGLTKTGAGSLTLSGANIHTGATTVNAGSLVLGTATTLTGTNPVTLAGTGALDLNGFSPTIGTLTSTVATSAIVNNGSGTGTDTLAFASGGNVEAAIANGATRTTALRVTNENGNFRLANASSTFSGGIVLTNSATGTRLSPGTVVAGAYGTGAITIGEAPSDLAGIYFATATQNFTNPIIVNTAQGTDRVGFRSDVAGITLSGVITANLAPATFTSNNAAGAFILTNQVTGASGVVLDITSKSSASTQFLVSLNNTTINPNNYQGDTVINFNAASGKSATLQLLAPDQIPNGVNAGNVIVNANGTGVGLLSLAGGSETINGLSGSGNVESTSGTVTLTLGDNNATASHSGAISNASGTLSVTKIGSGVQTLSGTSTFGGVLSVNGGLVAFPSSPATSGPLGNSTAVNLSGGGISYTAAGPNALNRPVAILGSVGRVDVANATGALSFGASSTGGDLVKTGPGAALLTGSTELNLTANGAGVVVNDGTLQAGFGVTDVATVTVGATGNLSLADSNAELLTLDTSAGALTLDGGAQLGFEVNAAASDSIAVATGGTAVTSGVVALNLFNTGAGIQATTYTLLTAPGGLAGATYVLGTAPGGFNYTINASDTAVSVTVVPETLIYWRGGQNAQWSTLGSAPANWTTDTGGAADALSVPVLANAVVFSATGAPVTSEIDAPFTVDSLQFASSHTITASGSGALTLTPVSVSNGLRVLSGATATISAPLTTGAAQTWNVESTGSLILGGNTIFTGSVSKTNTGALTLSGANSGTGAITLAGGTLNLNSATALGGGLFTIGAGTTVNAPASAITLTTNNAQVWSGDYTFTGSNNLDLGTGSVTLGASLVLNTAGSVLTVGGNIGDGGNNRGLTKTGAGSLVLGGANGYGGLTSINAGVLRITNGAGLGTTAAGTSQSGTSALELDGTGGDITVGAEALTINGGGITDLGALRNIAGNNTYGGTVTLAAQSRINSVSGTLTLGNATAVSSPNLTLVVGGAGNTNISGNVTLGSGGIAKDGAGVLTLGGTNTYTGTTGLNAGTLNVTGTITGNTTSSTLALGGSAGNTVVNVSNDMTLFAISGANAAGSNAVYNQTAGTVTISPGTANTQYVANNGYGYFNLTGGTFRDLNRFDVVQNTASTGAVGVAYIGSTLNNNNGEWMIIGFGGVGQMTVGAGGNVTRVGATQPLGIVMNSTGANGILNLAGGSVDTGAQPIRFGNGNISNTTGYVNLAAGTLSVGTVGTINISTGSGNNAYYNFAGGTLRTSVALASGYAPAATGTTAVTSTIFGAIDNNGTANDFAGGLTVDTNGLNSTFANVLAGSTAASAVGVTQADLTISGGSGYIGAPAVQFSTAGVTAGGTPASGYALVSGGSVTGIVITNPGTYVSGTIPTVTLSGGGASITPATVTSGALTTPNTPGGLTKTGAGTLTLSGANTYSGPTTVNGGTLQLNGAAAGTPATSAVTVSTGGTLGFTAATADTLNLGTKDLTLSGGTLAFDIGDAGVNDAITVNNFTLSANSAFNFTSIGAVGGSYTLVTSANPITNTGSHTITGQTIGRVTLTPTVNTNTITIDSTVFEGKWNQAGGGNWSSGDPNATLGNWDNYKPTVAGDAALFGDSITAPSSVLVDTPHIVGYLRFDNANAYTIGANGSSNLTLNNGASNAVATVTTGSHTIAENVTLLSHLDVIPASGTTLTMSGVLSGATRNLELNGPGNLVLSGVHTYGGTTTVSNGALTLSGARTATMGAITVGNLPSTTGTLNISNGTFTAGTFSVGSGTNALTAGVVNHTGGTLTTSGSQLLLGNNGTGLVPGSNSTGTYNLNGGTLNTVVAAGSTGILIGVNTGTTGVFNMMSGTLNMAAGSTMQIARSDNSPALATTGSFIQTGGTATVGILQMSGTAAGAANNAAGSSTLTLTGGTFSAASFGALSGGNQSSSTITIGGTAQVTLPVFPTNVKGTSATATITFDSTTGFLSPAAASTTYLPAGTFNNAYLTANGANLNVPSGRDITIAQVLSDAPSFAGTLRKSGPGALTLSAANTYTGTATVSEGTLALGSVDALGTTAAGTTVASGGRVIFGGLATASTVAEGFDIAGTGTASNGALNVGGNRTINMTGPVTLSGNASVTADGGSAFNFSNASAFTGTNTNLTVQTDGSVANTISGVVSLGTGSLTKAGTSTLILSGDNAYSGGTTITGGILAIPSTGDAGTGSISIAGGVRLELGAVTLANAINLGANGGVVGRGLVEGTNGVTTLNGPISATVGPVAGGTFATTGAGTLLNLNGAITSTPATLPISVRVGNVNFGGGGNYTDLRLSGNIGLNADDGISTSAVTLVGASVACVIDLKGFDQSLAGMTKGGSAASVVNSVAATTSTLTLTSALSSTNAVTLAGTGSGILAVTQAGSAVQTLSAANTYTGPTTVNSGTLAAGVASVANVSGAFGNNSAVIMANDATAVLDITGFNTQIGSITGGGATGGNVNLGAAVLTVGGDNSSPAAYAGAISGTGGLTKIGTGTQILSGANTYNGNTTVSVGTLALVGGSHASPITVSSGASLGFTLGAPTTSTSTFNLSAGTIKITGTPTLPSYTLISASAGITGTPVLDAPIAGYVLKKVGNTLVLENPYEAWAAANGATGGPTGDPDSDGVENLLEYAFGTNPAVGSSGPGDLVYSGGVLTSPGQPILEEDGGVWYAVFCRRVDYLDEGLIYTVEFSNALSAWTPTTAPPTVIATDGVIDVVRVPFLNFVPSDNGPQKPTFFRVEVTQ